jgi:hypothetical protein
VGYLGLVNYLLWGFEVEDFSSVLPPLKNDLIPAQQEIAKLVRKESGDVCGLG